MTITLREMHRRKADAEGEIAAALFFAGVIAKTKRPKVSDLRRAHDRMLKTLCVIIDILDGDAESNFACEACGAPITRGQHYVHSSEDSLDFHASCAGVPNSEASRMETAKEARAELRERVSATREYLAKTRRWS